jgi:hypothetical protein
VNASANKTGNRAPSIEKHNPLFLAYTVRMLAHGYIDKLQYLKSHLNVLFSLVLLSFQYALCMLDTDRNAGKGIRVYSFINSYNIGL